MEVTKASRGPNEPLVRCIHSHLLEPQKQARFSKPIGESLEG